VIVRHYSSDVDSRRSEGRRIAAFPSLRATAWRRFLVASLGLCIGSVAFAKEAPAGFSAELIRAKAGNVASAHRSKGILDGGDITNQGIVLVAAGAVHEDTDTDGVLEVGESIAYHYTVLNLGTSTLSSLSLNDSFGAVTCPQPTLAPGAFMICTRSHPVDAGNQADGAVGNLVEVAGQDAEGRAVQASDATLTQNLGGGAGIRVFKSPDVLQDTDASNTVTEGDVLRYTFVVKNSNAETLNAITLTEPDPSRIDTPISCSATSLDGAAFGANGSGTLVSNDVVLCTADYTVDAADIAAGEVGNEVQVAAVAPIAGNQVGTGTSLVIVPLVEVTLAKTLTGGGPIAEAGELLTYTLTLRATTATGRSFAAGSIGETVPANTEHVAGDSFTCAGTAAGSTCSNTAAVDVPGNGSVNLSFTVRVLDPAPAGETSITNVATPPTGLACAPIEGCDETTPLRNQADLSVLKSGPPEVERGDTVTFTIVVENLGPDTAANARLEDPTPTGLVFVSTSGACSGPFPCALGDVESGGTRTLTATYLVPADYAGPRTIINTVTVFSDSDDPTPEDSSSSSSVIVPGGSLAIPEPAVIPLDARWALVAMLLLIGAFGGIALRREG
jgi:uncharacterized repeat protein (TIGR01451 family)